MESEVYFAINPERTLIKIGFSSAVHVRLLALREIYGELALLGCISGDRWVEKSIHRDLHQYRDHREWFRAEPEVFEFIQRVLSDGYQASGEKERSTQNKKRATKTLSVRLKAETFEKLKSQVESINKKRDGSRSSVCMLAGYLIHKSLQDDNCAPRID